MKLQIKGDNQTYKDCKDFELHKLSGMVPRRLLLLSSLAWEHTEGHVAVKVSCSRQVIVWVHCYGLSLIFLTRQQSRMYHLHLLPRHSTTLHIASFLHYGDSTAIKLWFALIRGHHTYNASRFGALARLSGMVPLRLLLWRSLRWWHDEGDILIMVCCLQNNVVYVCLGVRC